MPEKLRANFEPMEILIISATFNEIKPFCEKFGFNQSNLQKTINDNQIKILITQPGILATAFSLGKYLQKNNCDLLINVGICGAISNKLKIGETVQIISEELGDFGAEDDQKFIPAAELKIIDAADFLSHRKLKPNLFEHPFLQQFKKAKGLTVNKVHGNNASIEKLKKRSDTEIESMEGAACFYAAMNENIPIVQLRTISNFVEKRNTSKWNIPPAINNLNNNLIKFLNELN